MTEKEKMLAGKLYNAADAELKSLRTKARLAIQKLNSALPDNDNTIKEILKELIPSQGENFWIEPPFYCDYGTNIHAGDNVYFNYDCTILDVCEVRIGNDCMFGPAVQIYAPLHPMNAKERATLIEYGKPVTIGNNVWVGGNATILPGVNIGDRCVIGAGSVVTKDIPPDSFAAGNPAKVIRTINKES
ncbi:MAG: maltose acetyltransferase [Sphingobacteriales bacterium 41-5]|nr:MAG: maltose acetyltransferase [Sphingobacteriales bacterium 41-5]